MSSILPLKINGIVILLRVKTPFNTKVRWSTKGSGYEGYRLNKGGVITRVSILDAPKVGSSIVGVGFL